MRKIAFWFVVNILLVGMVVGLSFWLYGLIQDKQVANFIEEKQKTVLLREKGNVQEGNIGSTHVVATLPMDDNGQIPKAIKARMFSYIQKYVGNNKPSGQIKSLLFVSSKETSTNFKNIRAREIQAEKYRVDQLKIKEQEKISADCVLLTQDNQLFTLGSFLTNLSDASKIMESRLRDTLTAKGIVAYDIEASMTKFATLDLTSISFSYNDSQMTMQFPEDFPNISNLSLPISDLYPVVNSEYLADVDKQGYDQYIAKKEADKKASRQVALTFDDGPNPATTPVVLDLLKKYNVKATFFVVGKAIAGNETILKRMVAEGHVVANHTWNHPNLVKIPIEQVKKEIQDTQAAIEAATGIPSTMVRPPYGSVNQAVIDQMGLPSIYWSVDSKDWKSRNAQAIFQEVKAHVCSGSIILMHDIHQPTVDSLESVLQYLTAEKYSMVTVPELLGTGLDSQRIYYSRESSGLAH